jgi:hypothetical protein
MKDSWPGLKLNRKSSGAHEQAQPKESGMCHYFIDLAVDAR